MKRPDAVDELRYTFRPLPRACTPLPGETVSSYLRRLASANLMDRETRRTLVTGACRQAAGPRPAVLSRLSGCPERTQRRALPELASPAPGAGARRASLPGRWPGLPALQCRTVRRGRRTGVARPGRRAVPAPPPVDHRSRPNRAAAPARRAARDTDRVPRLAAAGPRARAYAVIDAWRASGSYDYTRTDGFSERIGRFLGPGWSVYISSPFVAAAKYPQAVALTRLLASPHWTDLVTGDHTRAGRPAGERSALGAPALPGHRGKTLAPGSSGGSTAGRLTQFSWPT
ncbi:hypothetical protein EAS64_10540 [Trebonia kvetii]|uniref:Uncharacterized protein n=1 Tax=Trebonia kvetii TaxID=2480626 RepID=A0A6P2C1M3_9ACTN|nr:hypothetical protein [Trebonia kvetii]TVZ05050.1 hypothetical protein EAS64_10540 [Trebonia kvetii]